MAQVALINLTEDWQLVEDAISEARGESFVFDADKTYQFQFNNGDSPAVFVEPEDIGDVKSNEGNITDMKGLVTIMYKPGDNLLYGKAISEFCQVNVTVLGE